MTGDIYPGGGTGDMVSNAVSNAGKEQGGNRYAGALAGLIGGIGQSMMSPDARHTFAAGKAAMIDARNTAYARQFQQHENEFANTQAERLRRRQGISYTPGNRSTGVNMPKMATDGNSGADNFQIK